MPSSSSTSAIGGLSISPAAVPTSVPSTSGTHTGTSGQSSQQQHHHQQQPNPAMPTAADFSLMLSLGLGLNPADASQLANWDISKLAMYLVSVCCILKIKNECVMNNLF